MNKNKCLYEAPTIEILVVRFEEAILKISGNGNTISGATVDEWGGEL